jgi:F0F1-type ATP synthase membrane subunit b/b'
MPRDFDDLDDDLIDDTFPTPAPVQARMGDSEVLLRRAVDIIATAPSIPLSSTPRIDRDEIIELLEDALERLPEEIRAARWMLKERQEFLDKTKREADEIITAARQQAERMVQRTEVVRAAELRARQVVEAAEEESRRQRNETEDFLDQRLASFEILIDRLQKTVHNGRQRLSIGMHEEPAPAPQEDEPAPGSGFFDQDLH